MATDKWATATRDKWAADMGARAKWARAKWPMAKRAMAKWARATWAQWAKAATRLGLEPLGS